MIRDITPGRGARLAALLPQDLDRSLPFLTIGPMTIRDMLWTMVLLHGIHHRGQLALMCRHAGGRPTGLFGPTREEMPLPRATDAAASR